MFYINVKVLMSSHTPPYQKAFKRDGWASGAVLLFGYGKTYIYC